MATLLCPETIKSIKTLCDLFNVTSSLPQSKKKPSPSIMLGEFLKSSSSKENLENSNNIRNWFENLNSHQFQSVFQHCSIVVSTILIQMHIHKTHNGNITFALQSKISKKVQELDLRHFFCMKKVISSNSVKNQAECVLEKSLRFYETEEYCDSLSLDFSAFQTPSDLLKLLETLTDGNLFKVPCKAYWSSAIRKWIYEFPAWHDPHSFSSLALWACASFERNIWTHYWKSTKEDPRALGESHIFDSKEPNEIETLRIDMVNDYFCSIPQQQKNKIVEEAENHKNIFADVEKQLATIAREKIPDFCGPVPAEFYFTMNTSNNYQNIKSLEAIQINLRENSKRFVEFLLLSPLNRIGSKLDVVLRIIGLKIKTACNNKLSNEVTLPGVSDSNCESRSRLRPKQTGRKCKQPKKFVIRSETEKKTEEIEGTKSAVKNLLDSIFSNLYQSLADPVAVIPPVQSPKIDESEFQTVSQRRTKRPQPQPQQKRPYFPSDPQKSKPKLQTRAPKPLPHKSKPVPPRPKKSPQLWECSSIPSAPPSSESDFPPLCPSISPQDQYDTLHSEILRYSSLTFRKVQDKSKHIFLMLDKISSIVGDLLGAVIHLYGSYATHLAIDSSDIDLAVYGVEFQSRQSLQEACTSLAKALEVLPFVISCNAIITAKIPIIKLHTDTQIFSGKSSSEMIDITFIDTVDGSHQGIEAISFTRDLLILFPHIQCLAIVLKNFLYSISLNSAYHGNSKVGGLSSYSLVLWIAAALNSMASVPEDLGVLLEYFLDFFGNKFNPKRFGINIVNRGSLFMLAEGGFEHAVTVDPINHNNNTTRTSYRIDEVVREFAQAHARLKEALSKGRRRATLKQIFKKFNR